VQNVAFKHLIRKICLYWHCNALQFGNKLTVPYANYYYIVSTFLVEHEVPPAGPSNFPRLIVSEV